MDHLVAKAPPEAVDWYASMAIAMELNGNYRGAGQFVKNIAVRVWRAPRIREIDHAD